MSRTTDEGDADAALDVVEIDRTPPQRYRWRCPGGHIEWDRTNSHIWCRRCRREAERGRDIDPEHYAIVDDKTGETIAWERVKIVEAP